MTKQSGLGSAFWFGRYDLSGDIGALSSIGLTRAMIDVTGLDKDGTERISGRSDGEVSYTGFWNAATGRSVPVLSAMPAASVATCALPASLGSYAACLVGNASSFASQSGQDGSLAVSGQVQASGGTVLEWGRLLTAGAESFASAAAGTYIDRGAGSASNFGMAVYLHVISIGTGSATVTVQDSADHSAWDSVVAFPAKSAAGAWRVQTASPTENVRRYLRVDVSGTFTNLVAAVVAVPYTHA